MTEFFEPKNKPEVDYTEAKHGGDLLEMLNDKGELWAKAFCQYYKKHVDKNVDLDESFCHVWFANAIERSNDFRRWEREKNQSFEDQANT